MLIDISIVYTYSLISSTLTPNQPTESDKSFFFQRHRTRTLLIMDQVLFSLTLAESPKFRPFMLFADLIPGKENGDGEVVLRLDNPILVVVGGMAYRLRFADSTGKAGSEIKPTPPTETQWSSKPPHKPGVWAWKRTRGDESEGTGVMIVDEKPFTKGVIWRWSLDSLWAFISDMPTIKPPAPPLLPCKICGKFPEPVTSRVFFAYNHHGGDRQERGVTAHQVSTVFRKTQAEADNDWNTINA